MLAILIEDFEEKNHPFITIIEPGKREAERLAIPESTVGLSSGPSPS